MKGEEIIIVRMKENGKEKMKERMITRISEFNNI